MSVSWEHAYGACKPAAAEVLRALATLGLATVSSPALAAAAGLSLGEARTCLAELGHAGWLSAGEHHTIAESARTWLVRNAAAVVEPGRAAAIVRAFTEYHAAEVDPERHDPAEVRTWLLQHRAEVLAAIQACDRKGLRRLGTRLAGAVWRSAGSVPDPQWWQELARAGEALAIADRDPAALAELLHRSATTFAEHGDRLRAEAQWVRALAIIRRPSHGRDQVDQHARGVAILTGLAELYRGWGRLSKALDAGLGLVDLRREAGDAVGTAKALTTVAATMHATGRSSSAADYFAQADEALTPLTEAAGAPAELVTFHARVLVRWGRACWDQGQHAAARRPWSRALAMLIDVDDEAADQVRTLLATAPDRPLPKDYGTGLSNTSSSSSGGKG